MDPEDLHIRMFFFPIRAAIPDPLPALVQGVVGGVKDDIKSRLIKCISHFIRGVKGRISRDPELFSAQDHFLIHDGQIRVFYQLLSF